jgi:hypothetical protein
LLSKKAEELKRDALSLALKCFSYNITPSDPYISCYIPPYRTVRPQVVTLTLLSYKTPLGETALPVYEVTGAHSFRSKELPDGLFLSYGRWGDIYLVWKVRGEPFVLPYEFESHLGYHIPLPALVALIEGVEFLLGDVGDRLGRVEKFEKLAESEVFCELGEGGWHSLLTMIAEKCEGLPHTVLPLLCDSMALKGLPAEAMMKGIAIELGAESIMTPFGRKLDIPVIIHYGFPTDWVLKLKAAGEGVMLALYSEIELHCMLYVSWGWFSTGVDIYLPEWGGRRAYDIINERFGEFPTVLLYALLRALERLEKVTPQMVYEQLIGQLRPPRGGDTKSKGVGSK